MPPKEKPKSKKPSSIAKNNKIAKKKDAKKDAKPKAGGAKKDAKPKAGGGAKKDAKGKAKDKAKDKDKEKKGAAAKPAKKKARGASGDAAVVLLALEREMDAAKRGYTNLTNELADIRAHATGSEVPSALSEAPDMKARRKAQAEAKRRAASGEDGEDAAAAAPGKAGGRGGPAVARMGGGVNPLPIHESLLVALSADDLYTATTVIGDAAEVRCSLALP